MRRPLRRDGHYDALVSLGAVNGVLAVDLAIDALSGLSLVDVAEFVGRHKVCGIVRDRLADDHPLLEHFGQRLARRDGVAATIQPGTEELAAAGDACGVRVVGIKGLASRGWYAEPGLRDVGDFDIAVASADDGWRLAGHLRGAGFCFDDGEPPWLKRWSDGELYGQALLRRTEGSLPMAVDIHFGGYSVRHCGRLPIEASGAPGYARLERTENIALVVANAAGDEFTTVKDLNDLYLSLEADDLDADKLWALVREAALDGYLLGMLDRLDRHYASNACVARRSADLRRRARYRREPSVSLAGPNWTQRWLVTGVHAARLGGRRSPRQALKCARSAVAYYRRPLRLELDAEARPTMLDELNAWTCIRLITVDTAKAQLAVEPAPNVPAIVERSTICGELERLATSAGDLVALGDDVFVPTVFHKVTRSLVGDALALGRDRVASSEELTTRPSARHVFGLVRARMSPGLALAQRLSAATRYEWQSFGAKVVLSDGSEAIDFGSYGVALLGHRHPAVVAAVSAQLQQMPTSTRIVPNLTSVSLADELIAFIDRAGIERVWFGLNGADAVEFALKLARLATGRTRVLAARGGFHGKSLGALSATWNPLLRAGSEAVLSPSTHLSIDDPDAVRRACADGAPVAALIVEPILGEGGVRSIDPTMLRRWAADAHADGAFVVVDEIQTGLGRAGARSLAHEMDVPFDAILLGKSLGGGVMPLSAVLGTRGFFAALDHDPLHHMLTFSGHPLATAAGRAALPAIASLEARAAKIASTVGSTLAEIATRHTEVVKEVRGRGLLWAVEMTSPEAAGELLVHLGQAGLLLSPCLSDTSTVRFLPPMVAEDGDLDLAHGILDDACVVVEQAVAG